MMIDIDIYIFFVNFLKTIIIISRHQQSTMFRTSEREQRPAKSINDQHGLGQQLLPQKSNQLKDQLNLNDDELGLSQSIKNMKISSHKRSNIKDSIKKCIKKSIKILLNPIQQQPRTIYLTGQCEPINKQSNLVKNTKYNIFTFIPKVLFNQFKFFFNLFFLLTALSQLIQLFKVGLFVTYIGPLALVLSLTMAKQAYDDYRVYLKDIQANSKVYQVIRKSKKQMIKSKDLRVGDVVIVKSGNRIPADMITLYSDDEQGTLFLKTDQLDGETDWKLRKAVKKTQSIVKLQRNYSSLIDRNLTFTVKQPIGQIYNFQGVFKSGQQKQKLTLQNTMWTSCVLTNGLIIGLVIYVGRQTRISLGASQPRTKVGCLDHEINFLSKILFLIMAALTIMLIILQRTQWSYMPIQFVRILILLSSIIPISMRVNLDFAKLFYAFQINNDKYIKGAITRNSNCPQQLGRVKYILSDKTGTLTQNQMIFRKISIQDTIKFTDQNQGQIKTIMQDYDNIPQNIHSKQKCLKNILTALALCHNVTPVYQDGNQKQKVNTINSQKYIIQSLQKDQKLLNSSLQQISPQQRKKQFQASSPDQIAFVKIVQKFGLILHSRTQTDITLNLPSHKSVKYNILNIFPFSSQTKRMGIIVKNTQTNKITFYLKGADVVMKKLINNKLKVGFLQQQCRDLSMTGLRTLVITYKQLSQQQYSTWFKKYQQVYNKLSVNKHQIQSVMKLLQNGVQFLGITGIQDKLQNNLKISIQSLKSANIKIWMITGDKIQTAQCISRSCGLQHSTQQNIKIQQIDNLVQWKQKWNIVKQNLTKILIIDGHTLQFLLQKQQIDQNQKNDLIKDFYETAMKMPAVICCRCSPQQKRILTQGVKKHRKPKQSVLGIGDGGNDVGMIQAADIGIGIVGKQGNQAALAADFSIMEFKDLKCLLLWHGRLSYKRSALLANFIIHRGFIVSTIQIIFSCLFYFVSIPVFNSYLQLGYATIFTFWPVFSLILDEDIDKKRALKYPALYDSLQSTQYLSIINFISWIWKASYQGTLIMILTIVFFNQDTYLKIQTICFTILILTQYCMSLSQLHQMHILTLASVGGSLVSYLLCLFFLKNAINLGSLSLVDFLFILIITLISWGPLLAWRLIKAKFYPNDYEKVMKNVQRKFIERKILKSSIDQIGQQTRESALNYY